MKSGIAGIVHIVPLGQEFDRAVRPFDSAAANLVRIVADSRDESGEYAARVVRYLKKKHIPAEVAKTDLEDMGGLLQTIASLIRREQERGNTVYVNMSAAGEMAAAAATIAGMALGAEVYCVHADRYATDAERRGNGVSVCSTDTVSILPRVDIGLPEETELPVLEEMYLADEQTLSASDISNVVGDRDVLMKDCCDASPALCMLNESVGIGPDEDRWEQRRVQSRNLMKVSGMMKKMEEKGYVTKSKAGRRMMYRLTERGLYALILSGRIG